MKSNVGAVWNVIITIIIVSTLIPVFGNDFTIQLTKIVIHRTRASPHNGDQAVHWTSNSSRQSDEAWCKNHVIYGRSDAKTT